MALTLNGNGQISSDNYTIDSDGSSSVTSLRISDVSRYDVNVSNSYAVQTALNAAGTSFATDYRNALQHTFQTSGTDRMTIDQSGYVTKPYNPAFVAYGAPATLTNSAIVVFSGTALNRDSVYNTSNGRFTAPVGGLYQFFASVRIETGVANATYHRLRFKHNGSLIQWTGSRLNFHTNGYYSHASNDQIVGMNAGDYVETSFESSLSSVNTSSVNEHVFYGYLVG